MRIVLNYTAFVMVLARLCLLFALVGVAPVGFSTAQATEMKESIAAVVNEDPITQREVKERLSLVLASSELPDRQEIRQRLKPQILNQLIEEQLKIQEAKSLEIDIPEEAIKQGIRSVAQSNGMDYDQFLSLLTRKGVKIRTLRRQVRAQLAWSQVVAAKLRPKIRITDQDIDAELSRLKDNIGKTEYLLAEIYLPFDDNNTPARVEKFANNLVRQMVEKRAPFQKIAQQFSQSAAAARGGDLGWIQKGQLPENLDEAAQEMQNGSLSKPIKTLSGYHILLLRDKREITQETLPTRDEIKERLGLERLDRLQRRHLLDLRSSAFIDVRV